VIALPSRLVEGAQLKWTASPCTSGGVFKKKGIGRFRLVKKRWCAAGTTCGMRATAASKAATGLLPSKLAASGSFWMAARTTGA
jgi:hypothetical protein